MVLKIKCNYDILIISVVINMFGRAFRLLKNCKPLLATSLFAVGLGMKKIKFDQKKSHELKPDFDVRLDPYRMLRKIISKDVCDSKSIGQGQLYIVQVTEEPEDGSPAKTYKIAIARVKGKLYAVLGHCTYKQPISDETIQQNNFADAIIFNDKLYCPHHGCAFDVKSGTVEYGPAMENLPRFFVQQKQGRIKLHYPSKIPISVMPQLQLRDLNDLRKVVILGGDHNATMGVINGLKQYDYGGEITVIHNSQEDYSIPFRNDLIHRKLINLSNLKKDTKNKKKKYKQSQIQNILQEKIYSKLTFFDELWYQGLGIQFIFNTEIFRVINKKYYPYIKFFDDTKVQFDGIVYATGFLPSFPSIKGLTHRTNPQTNNKLDLPINVFAPFYHKKEHIRMLKFFNQKQIDNLLVVGMNAESLEFVEAFMKEFPKTKVKIMDINKQNTINQIFGPEIGNQILSQYTKRGVQMFVKIQQIPSCKNTLETAIGLQDQNIANSIKVKLDDKTELKADCAVLFPNNTIGNTQAIKNSKYVDIDYNKINGRIIVDPNSRTDTRRMFAAGSCSSLEFFFTRDRIELINPLAAYEQGMTAGFNLNALNVPFHYIPFQTHTYFGKKILYAGARKNFNSMYILGNVKTWDFIAFYALENDIVAVSASPSMQKQFQVIRQAFRLQCAPTLDKIIKQKWNIALVYKLITKLNKSGCYKDLIHELDPMMNIPEVIWMQRDKGSFSGSEVEDESNVEVDQRGYVTQV